MKTTTASTLFGAALLAALPASAAPTEKLTFKPKRDVDTRFPYTGPAIPIGDWVDDTVNGNGKGFIRLVEGPAVTPSSNVTTNSVNVISLAYIPNGMTVHYQTPFGLDSAPTVHYGPSASDLCYTATGYTTTYDRTPPCSLAMTTMCSQFFHNVLLENLEPGTVYYYSIPSSNGTTASPTLSFTTARAPGDSTEFTVAVLNDMGYTNAQGTYQYLNLAADSVAFAWHGGDISYADDWFDGILACDKGEVCYNGTDSYLYNTPPAPFPEEYNIPVPEGEIPDQGGPQGGDASPIYEVNWDIWQQWMNSIFMKVPYMVSPGNHEAACGEFDGPGNITTALLNDNITNGTAPESDLTYYSCPPSQRNFTTYQHRFRMPGNETGGVSNFWYSFDYGNAHFITIDGETDFAYSPEWPFARDLKGNETLPTEEQTFITDSGPFGYINGSWKDNKAYEQLAWLEKDLAAVNRTATPWVFAMTHRPMYSSELSSYETNVRNAFEPILLKYNGTSTPPQAYGAVDAYFAGHIHWYERIKPMNNLSIILSDIVNDNTYSTGTGKSLTTIVNGMAGNIESHSSINPNATLEYTAVLNQYDFGFSKLTIHNDSVATWQYIKGIDGSVGDTLTMLHSNPLPATASVESLSVATTTASASATSATVSSPITTTHSSPAASATS